jgi:glycosyltransferase involved in cell wall biosynthesis
LVEACELLAEDAKLPPFELHVAGYLSAGDRAYLRELERRIERGRLAGRYRFHGELDRAGKIRFLQSLHVFSTPTVYRESKGLPALEALANGVPVVLPDHGGFPEIVAQTGGGLLHRPHDERDLADKLAEILRNPQLGSELGARGRQAVHETFTARQMAKETRSLYEKLIANSAVPGGR